MLISAYVREKDRVLDFACGKGGDLTKYRKANVGTYTGVDIALESVRRDAVERYNGGGYPFPARFIAGDCFTADLTEVLEERALTSSAVSSPCTTGASPTAPPRRRPRPSRRPRSNDTLTLHVERYPHPTHTPSRYPHASNRAAGAPRSARVARSAT